MVFQESLARSPVIWLLLQGVVRLNHALQVLLSRRQSVPQAGSGAVLCDPWSWQQPQRPLDRWGCSLIAAVGTLS